MNMGTLIFAIQEWFSKNGISYKEAIFHEFCGDAAQYSSQAGFDDWRFFEFKTPPPKEHDIILGISGRSEASTFSYVDDDGWLDFDNFPQDFKTPADLIAWLEKQAEM